MLTEDTDDSDSREDVKFTYAIDTSVLLNRPSSLYILSGNVIPDPDENDRYLNLRKIRGEGMPDGKPNNIILSDIVIREINRFVKNGGLTDMRSIASREAEALIHMVCSEHDFERCNPQGDVITPDSTIDSGVEAALRTSDRSDPIGRTKYGTLNRMFEMENGAKIFFLEPNVESFDSLRIPQATNSDRLIHHLLQLHNSGKHHNLTYITMAPNRSSKAIMTGLTVEEFKYANVPNVNQLYPGCSTHNISGLTEAIKRSIAELKPFTMSADSCRARIGRVPKPNQFQEFVVSDSESGVYYIAKPTDAERTAISFKPVTGHEKLMEMIKRYRGHREPSFDINELDIESRRQLIIGMEGKLGGDSSSGASRKRRKKRKVQSQNNYSNLSNPETFTKLYRQLCNRLGEPSPAQIAAIIEGKKTEKGFVSTGDWKYNLHLNLTDELKIVHEHIPYLELLYDDDIKLVTLNGPPGTGKSLLAIYMGLMKVLDRDTPYRSLYYTRAFNYVGKDIGALPGGVEEKTADLKRALMKSLGYICSSRYALNSEQRRNVEEQVQALFTEGVIMFDPITFLRGDTIFNSYIIVDEAQSLTQTEADLYVGRGGEGSKIVMIGDLKQIDRNRGVNPYLTKKSSGLAYTIERNADKEITGHIHLPKRCVMRSELAKLAD